MRSFGQLPLILFFIKGMVPTESEAAEAASYSDRARVVFRNAALVDPNGDSALEECDGVLGDVPERYQRVFGSPPDAVSGIGSLREVHDGEPGVTDAQAVNLDSRSTGDPIEEERRRAHRGLSVNDPNARPVWDDPRSRRTTPDDKPIAGGSLGPAWGDTPSGKAGAAQVAITDPDARRAALEGEGEGEDATADRPKRRGRAKEAESA